MLKIFVLFAVFVFGVTSKPTDTKTETSRTVQLVNEFGLQLIQSLQQNDDQNVVLSPVALQKNLLSALKGSSGQTEKELKQILFLEDKDNPKTIEEDLEKILIKVLDEEEEDLELRILTRLLVNRKGKSSLKETFKRAVKEELLSDWEEVDFTADSRLITKNLNLWLNKGSNKKINRFFKDDIPPESSTVLLSAMSLSLKPKNGFRELKEKKEFQNFVSYNLPPMARSVSYLESKDSFKSKTSSELKSDLIEIPFKRNLSLIIVEPQDIESLQYLNENITSSQLMSEIRDLLSTDPKTRRLLLPKLKLEFELDLKEAFEDFSESKTLFTSAEFKDDFRSSNSEQKISLSLHKAVFELESEEGREDGGSEEMETLFVDRPFMFLLFEREKEIVLVLGKINHLVDDEALGLGFI